MGIVYVDSKLNMQDSAGVVSGSGRPRCASCNDEIMREPVERDGQLYCCDGCANGGPCIC